MTRINVGIPPQRLSDMHLIAEHREIKRIPNHLAKFGLRSLDNKPGEFKLGTGHVKFFLDKGLYTYRRYNAIYKECIKRGFKVQYYGDAWKIYTDFRYMALMKPYKPTPRDLRIILERINQRGGLKAPL